MKAYLRKFANENPFSSAALFSLLMMGVGIVLAEPMLGPLPVSVLPYVAVGELIWAKLLLNEKKATLPPHKFLSARKNVYGVMFGQLIAVSIYFATQAGLGTAIRSYILGKEMKAYASYITQSAVQPTPLIPTTLLAANPAITSLRPKP